MKPHPEEHRRIHRRFDQIRPDPKLDMHHMLLTRLRGAARHLYKRMSFAWVYGAQVPRIPVNYTVVRYRLLKRALE